MIDHTISKAKKIYLKFIIMIQRENLLKFALQIIIIVQLVAFMDFTDSRGYNLKSGNLTLWIGYRVTVIYQSIILYFTNIKYQSMIHKFLGFVYVIAFSTIIVYDGLCYPNLKIKFKLSWAFGLFVIIAFLCLVVNQRSMWQKNVFQVIFQSM